MKKRTKVPKSNTINFDEPTSVISRPPNSPPTYVPPTPEVVFSRLNQINDQIIPSTETATDLPNQVNSPPSHIETLIPAPDAKTMDLLSRLKAISNGETLPVPTSLPTLSVLPKVGIEFDSMLHIEAPKPDNPISVLAELELQETEENETGTTNQTIEFLQYDQPLGFGIAKAFKYAATHGLISNHKGDDEQILEYRDGEGNLIDTKAAFKLQSQIFSGRFSSIKNRQKAQVKARAYNNKDNFEVGDTPLHTATSLRKTLSENQTAFIELTGENKHVVPFEPLRLKVDEKVKAKKEKKKKRLKLKSKKIEEKEREEEIKEMEHNAD